MLKIRQEQMDKLAENGPVSEACDESIIQEGAEGLAQSNVAEFENRLNTLVKDEADTRVASGEIKGVALSRAGIVDQDIVSDSFDNFKITVKRTQGIERIEPLSDGLFKVVDKDQFINQIEQLYLESGEPLHPVMRARILNYVDNERTLELGGRGIPGTHAEVRAANQMLNQLPDGYDVSQIKVSTFRLAKPEEKQGEPFDACMNCGSILNGFDILTGDLSKP